MSDSNTEEFDLSAIIIHNAITNEPFFHSPSSSPNPEIQGNSETGPATAPKPINRRRGKKRSSRACTTCRQRKVRCNIIASGVPCSNCRHDEIECILPLSRRQRSAKERAERALRESLTGSDASRKCHHSMEAEEHTHVEKDIEETPSLINLGPHGMSLSEHPLADILPTETISPKKTQVRPGNQTSLRTRSWIQILPPLASAPIQLPTAKAPDQRLPILPPVFIPLPAHLQEADLMYLHTRDALTLPSENFQIALLRAYINYVHGSMPILDLEGFLSAAKYGHEGMSDHYGKSETTQITFLLFQAVMFAGVEFVSMKALKDAGWKSREECRRTMFGRVKLLYDFDTTADRLPILQTLLLMTLYTSEPRPTNPVFRASITKDASYYLNLAISLTFSMRLNRNLPIPKATSGNSQATRKRKLERRIFWAAFISDRLLAVTNKDGYKRPVQIKKEDCEVSIIEIYDFDLPSDEDSEESMRDLVNAQAFVEKALLCWHGSDATFGTASLKAPCQAPQAPVFQWQELQHLPIVEQEPERQGSVCQDEDPGINTTMTACSFPFASSRFQNLDANKDIEMGVEQEQEYSYHVPSSTTSSKSPLLTPHALEDDHPVAFALTSAEDVKCSKSPFNAGYGVDGEYDDFLELLRPSIEATTPKMEVATPILAAPMPKAGKKGVIGINRGIRERGTGGRMDRSTWAFGLDTESNCVLQV